MQRRRHCIAFTDMAERQSAIPPRCSALGHAHQVTNTLALQRLAEVGATTGPRDTVAHAHKVAHT